MPSANSGPVPEREASTDLPPKQAQILLLVITIAGLAARLFELSSQSLWMDEVASIGNMHHLASEGVRTLATIDRIAPLHTFILWAASAIAGEGAIAMRLPSVLAGAITVPVFYVVAFRLFASRRTALVAAILMALSPYAITYAQEARMYSLLMLCACAYVAVAWPVVERSLGLSELLLLTAVTSVGFYTHHYMLFLPATFGMFLILNGGLLQKRAWAWVWTQVMAFALFVPWLVISSEAMAGQTALPKPLFILWIPYTFFTFVAGLSYGPSVRELLSGNTGDVLRSHAPAIVFAAAVAAPLCLNGLVRSFRLPHRRAAIWTVAWLVAPLALAILATFVTKVQYNVRYAVVAYPPLVLWISLAVSDLITPGESKRSAFGAVIRGLGLTAAVGLAGVILLSLHNLYFNEQYAKEDVRPLAALLKKDTSDKLIVTDNVRIEPLLAYYGTQLPPGTLQVENLLWGSTPSIIVDKLSSLSATPGRDVWLIEYRTSNTDPEHRVKGQLEAMADLIGEQNWPGVGLKKFRLRASDIQQIKPSKSGPSTD